MSPRKSVHLPHAQDETIQALPSTFLYHLIEKLKHDVKSATTDILREHFFLYLRFCLKKSVCIHVCTCVS